MATAGAAEDDRWLVLDQLAATAGETRPFLLGTAGGEPFDTATLQGHGKADLGAAAACWITQTAQQEEQFINNEAR